MKSLLIILTLSLMSFANYSQETASGVTNLNNHLATPTAAPTTTNVADPNAQSAPALPVSTDGLNISADQQEELTKQLQLIKENQEKADKMLKEMEQD